MVYDIRPISSNGVCPKAPRLVLANFRQIQSISTGIKTGVSASVSVTPHPRQGRGRGEEGGSNYNGRWSLLAESYVVSCCIMLYGCCMKALDRD